MCYGYKLNIGEKVEKNHTMGNTTTWESQRVREDEKEHGKKHNSIQHNEPKQLMLLQTHRSYDPMPGSEVGLFRSSS